MVQLNRYCKRTFRAYADEMASVGGVEGNVYLEGLESAFALWCIFIQPCCTSVGRVEGTRYYIHRGVMGESRFMCNRCRIRVVYCPASVENFCSCMVPREYRVRLVAILGGAIMTAKTTNNRGLCVSCYVMDQLQQRLTMMAGDVWVALDGCKLYTLGQSGCVVHDRYMMLLVVPALMMFGEGSLHVSVLRCLVQKYVRAAFGGCVESFVGGMNNAHRAFARGCGNSIFGTGVCGSGLVDCSFDMLMSGDEFVDMFVEYMVEHYVTCGGLREVRRMLGLVVDGMLGCRLHMRGVLCRLFKGCLVTGVEGCVPDVGFRGCTLWWGVPGASRIIRSLLHLCRCCLYVWQRMVCL